MAIPNGKVILGDEVLMDLTGDNITPAKALKGTTFHGPSGAAQTGTCTYDADTSDATATEAELLEGSTGYARGKKIIGTRPRNGAVHLEIQDLSPVTIPMGDHDGSGTAGVNAADAEKITPENIREGVEILGVIGTMSGSEGVKAETVELVSGLTNLTRLPGPGFTHIAQVKVKGIPVTRTENAAGGMTVKIG